MLSASDLYAISVGGKNDGECECHFCSSRCRRIWTHNQPPRPLFTRPQDVRDTTYARRPASPWVCYGCWRWRWKRRTVNFLGGGFKDGQCLEAHSVLFTEEGEWAVRPSDPQDREALYGLLLKPPLRFCLAVVDGPKQTNHLHLALANDRAEGVEASTPLEFTVNGIRFDYTVYDLDRALRDGEGGQGKQPGVREIIRLFGEHKLADKDPQANRVGRYSIPETARAIRKNVVVKSGGAAVA